MAATNIKDQQQNENETDSLIPHTNSALPCGTTTADVNVPVASPVFLPHDPVKYSILGKGIDLLGWSLGSLGFPLNPFEFDKAGILKVYYSLHNL